MSYRPRMITNKLGVGLDAAIDWVTTDDGAQLRVATAGAADAPTIVLSHGWACSIEYWRPQIEALSREFRVVAYDQRGHGRSSRGRRSLDSDTLADDFAQIIDHTVGPERAVSVGHSMGGITIQAWWQRHPEQAARTGAANVLANTTWGGLARGTRVIPLLNGYVPVPVRLGKLALGTPIRIPQGRLVRGGVRWRTMNRRNATKEQAAFVADIVRHCNPAVRADTALALVDLDLGPAAAESITALTTVIVGRVDKLTPAWMGRSIADALERTGHLDHLIELDTGHAGNIEMPDVFNRIVTGVTRGAATPPGSIPVGPGSSDIRRESPTSAPDR